VSDLYDTDFVLWPEQQADRLRRLARGEQVNDVDLPNLVEEVEGLGWSATSAVRSLLLRALEHFLKAAAWPQAPSARKWPYEAGTFLDDVSDDWTPSVASRIDLAAVCAKVLRRIRALEFEEGEPGPLPDRCPVALDELLHGEATALSLRFRPPA
jgi:Domain of unknown function DUF29